MPISAKSWKPGNGSPVWLELETITFLYLASALGWACVLCGYQKPPSRSCARKAKKVISQGPGQGLFSHSAFPLRWRQKRCGLTLKLRKQPWGSSWAWVQPGGERVCCCCLLISTLLSCCPSTALKSISFGSVVASSKSTHQ